MLIQDVMTTIDIKIQEGNSSDMRKIDSWSIAGDLLINISERSSVQSSSDGEDDFSDTAYTIISVCLFFIFLLGSTTNLIVIIVICRCKKLRTPINAILVNLSCSDFTVSVLGTPLTFFSAVYHRWIFGERICHIYAFMMTLTGMTSIGTLTAVAIERYIIISRPCHSSAKLTSSSTAAVLAAIWSYSLIQAVPPLIGWNEYVIEQPGIACSVEWRTLDFNHTSYIVYLFFLGYFLPVSIMATCYVKIVFIVKRAPKLKGKSSTAKAEYRVTVMAWAMVVCTVTAWTPYATVSLMVALGFSEFIGPAASACPAVFAKASVIWNPIVYFFLNSQIKEALTDYLPCKRLYGLREVEVSMDILGKTGYNNTPVSTSSRLRPLDAIAPV